MFFGVCIKTTYLLWLIISSVVVLPPCIGPTNTVTFMLMGVFYSDDDEGKHGTQSRRT